MRRPVGALFLCALGLAAGAHAQDSRDPDPVSDSTGWQFALTPYAWGAGIRGDVDVGRFSANVNADFSDLWDKTNFGAAALFDVRRDRFAALLDSFYIDLQDDNSTVKRPRGGVFERLRADFKTQVIIVDQKVGYRIWSARKPEPARARGGREPMALDLFAGARFLRLDSDVDLRAGQLGRGGQKTIDWVDALLGFRLSGDLSQRFSLLLVADTGGFGIGSASKFTWAGLALLGWHLAPRWRLSAGYKLLQLDRDRADVWVQGPVIGLTYAF